MVSITTVSKLATDGYDTRHRHGTVELATDVSAFQAEKLDDKFLLYILMV